MIKRASGTGSDIQGGRLFFGAIRSEPQAANKYLYRRFKQEGVGMAETFLGSLKNRRPQ